MRVGELVELLVWTHEKRFLLFFVADSANELSSSHTTQQHWWVFFFSVSGFFVCETFSFTFVHFESFSYNNSGDMERRLATQEKRKNELNTRTSTLEVGE